ncbi:MAG: thioesterase superfamily protein [Polaromonas sp.]|jgi:4-hydroxybenzoyl-CoA thioesterase|nr:thioesterase superfamily protein [Polaromonas sp.]
MTFTVNKRVRFQHCDPAGIVFYPQFYVLLHEVQEDFMAHIGFPEHALIARGLGLPIVDMKTEFLGMCRHGDLLTITLTLNRIGGASLGMHYEIHAFPHASMAPSGIKLRADGVVVHSTVPHGKPQRIPDDLRSALLPYLLTLAPTP